MGGGRGGDGREGRRGRRGSMSGSLDCLRELLFRGPIKPRTSPSSSTRLYYPDFIGSY